MHPKGLHCWRSKTRVNLWVLCLGYAIFSCQPQAFRVKISDFEILFRNFDMSVGQRILELNEAKTKFYSYLDCMSKAIEVDVNRRNDKEYIDMLSKLNKRLLNGAIDLGYSVDKQYKLLYTHKEWCKYQQEYDNFNAYLNQLEAQYRALK